MIEGRSPVGSSDEWLTPPELVKMLGPFDLDPCSPVERPWDTAAHHYTVLDDGLSQPWEGLVWCNPPYGRQTARWMERMAAHGEGIALVYSRTETAWFKRSVWQLADVLVFLTGRLQFHLPDGTPSGSSGGAGSVLVAYGPTAVKRVLRAPLEGVRIDLRALTKRAAQ